MKPLLALAGAALLGLVVVLLLRAGRRRRQEGDLAEREDLTRELDRLENVLRRDPHRDDAWHMYRELLERAGPAERRQRKGFREDAD